MQKVNQIQQDPNIPLDVQKRVRATPQLGLNTDTMGFFMKSLPCAFQAKTNSCNFCELNKNSITNLTPVNIINQLDSAYSEYHPQESLPKLFQLFTLSSLIVDDPRIPNLRNTIVEYLAQKGVQELFVESRAEYLQATNRNGDNATNAILSMKEQIPHIDISLGIESTTDVVLKKLQKHLNQKTIKKSIDKIGELDVGLVSYLLVKPPGVFEGNNEVLALKDTIQSITDVCNYARQANLKSTIIYLNPYYLARDNKYAKKDLNNWSPLSTPATIYLVNKAHDITNKILGKNGTLHLGLSSEGLSDEISYTMPFGCDNSQYKKNLHNALETYCANQDMQSLNKIFEDHVKECSSCDAGYNVLSDALS